LNRPSSHKRGQGLRLKTPHGRLVPVTVSDVGLEPLNGLACTGESQRSNGLSNGVAIGFEKDLPKKRGVCWPLHLAQPERPSSFSHRPSLLFGLTRGYAAGKSAAAQEQGPGDDTGRTGTYHGIVFERFTPEARRVLVLSQEEARLLHCGSVGTECLLLGLVHDGDGLAARALVSLGIPLVAVREKVKETVDHAERSNVALPFSPRAKKVLELALREAHLLGHDYIGAEHLLLALLREGDGPAPRVLVSLGTDLSQLRQRVLQLAAPEQPQSSGKDAILVSAEESAGQLRFYGAVTRTSRPPVPWWRPLLARRVRQARQARRREFLSDPARDARRLEREREDRQSNARDLGDARAATKMSLAGLAEASGIDIERLRDAESAEPQVSLTVQEWFKLAVVFEGHTWDEYQAQAAKVRPSQLLAPTGHMLEGARAAIRNISSLDDH